MQVTKDITHILDSYNIQQTHIVGASMGGQVGMLFASTYPERTKSLTLCVTSPDMRATFDTFEGKETKSSLSKPSTALIAGVKKVMNPSQSMEEKINSFIENTKINYGSKVTIDEKLTKELAIETILRSQHNPNGGHNHFLAIKATYDLMPDAIAKIRAPTRIIHGDQDPVFGLDHAQALNKAISGSKLILLSGLGHGLPREFYGDVIKNISENTKVNS